MFVVRSSFVSTLIVFIGRLSVHFRVPRLFRFPFRVFRCFRGAMPNTPATVGAGMTAIAPGTSAKEEQIEQAKKIFNAVGEVVEVAESSIDAVTGLSGSGPAFVALAIEALADGGVASGLPRAIALQLATQTVLGTATLVKETGMHPGVLKDQVTSPGGTTIAGVAKLESVGFRSALIEAVKTAAERSRELGK